MKWSTPSVLLTTVTFGPRRQAASVEAESDFDCWPAQFPSPGPLAGSLPWDSQEGSLLCGSDNAQANRFEVQDRPLLAYKE